MDLGLGNLISLKRHLLAPSLVSQNDNDTVITDIGKGVAAAFDRHCNRKFERVAGETETFSADRRHVYLSRYPFESISQIEQRDSVSEGWEVLTDVIENQDEKTGMVYFGAMLGDWPSRIRITYTGGYWFDTAETEDTALPSGATQLPEDIRMAWFLQCAQVWDSKDKLGIGISSEPRRFSALATLELIPDVKAILNKHIRYAMT